MCIDPTVAFVVAGFFEEDLGRHLVEVTALGNQVAMTAVCAGDVVVVVQRTHDADRDRFLTHVGVERPIEPVFPGQEEILHGRFPLAAGLELLVEGQQPFLRKGGQHIKLQRHSTQPLALGAR